MSEFPNSTSEIDAPRVEATEFTSETALDLRLSKLQSAEQGRRFARQAREAIESAARLDGPRQPTPEQLARQGAETIAQYGSQIIGFRLEATGVTQPEDTSLFIGPVQKASEYEPTDPIKRY